MIIELVLMDFEYNVIEYKNNKIVDVTVCDVNTFERFIIPIDNVSTINNYLILDDKPYKIITKKIKKY